MARIELILSDESGLFRKAKSSIIVKGNNTKLMMLLAQAFLAEPELKKLVKTSLEGIDFATKMVEGEMGLKDLEKCDNCGLKHKIPTEKVKTKKKK